MVARLNATMGSTTEAWDPQVASRATRALMMPTRSGITQARELVTDYLQQHRYEVTTPNDRTVLRHRPSAPCSPCTSAPPAGSARLLGPGRQMLRMGMWTWRRMKKRFWGFPNNRL